VSQLIAEAGDSSCTQKERKVRWMPLLNNGSDDVTVASSVCVCVCV
jgi:hypothetical protein